MYRVYSRLPEGDHTPPTVTVDGLVRRALLLADPFLFQFIQGCSSGTPASRRANLFRVFVH